MNSLQSIIATSAKQQGLNETPTLAIWADLVVKDHNGADDYSYLAGLSLSLSLSLPPPPPLLFLFNDDTVIHRRGPNAGLLAGDRAARQAHPALFLDLHDHTVRPSAHQRRPAVFPEQKSVLGGVSVGGPRECQAVAGCCERGEAEPRGRLGSQRDDVHKLGRRSLRSRSVADCPGCMEPCRPVRAGRAADRARTAMNTWALVVLKKRLVHRQSSFLCRHCRQHNRWCVGVSPVSLLLLRYAKQSTFHLIVPTLNLRSLFLHTSRGIVV